MGKYFKIASIRLYASAIPIFHLFFFCHGSLDVQAKFSGQDVQARGLKAKIRRFLAWKVKNAVQAISFQAKAKFTGQAVFPASSFKAREWSLHSGLLSSRFSAWWATLQIY